MDIEHLSTVENVIHLLQRLASRLLEEEEDVDECTCAERAEDHVDLRRRRVSHEMGDGRPVHESSDRARETERDFEREERDDAARDFVDREEKPVLGLVDRAVLVESAGTEERVEEGS